MPPILKFDPSGQLLDSWGEERLAFPHGFHIDQDGNVWATDANGSETVLGLSAGGRGHQVFKFSASGELLMTLGKAGVAGNGPDTFNKPTDVAVAINGDIFVTDGHGMNNRVVKFSKDGSVAAFIPDPDLDRQEENRISGASGITADSLGSVYAADVGPHRVRKYVR